MQVSQLMVCFTHDFDDFTIHNADGTAPEAVRLLQHNAVRRGRSGVDSAGIFKSNAMFFLRATFLGVAFSVVVPVADGEDGEDHAKVRSFAGNVQAENEARVLAGSRVWRQAQFA